MTTALTTTFHLGLTGWPLEHSLSPDIHAAALRAAGLEGDYQLFPVPPLPAGSAALQELVASLRRGELHGLNVTSPHKKSILSFLDTLTPVAQAAGVANTIFQRAGQIIGDNTDVPGCLTDLESFAGWLFHEKNIQESHEGPQALLLGAGGAAQGVVYGLAQLGWTVHIAARRIEKAQELVSVVQNSFPPAYNQQRPQLHAHWLTREDIEGFLSEINLIVNATPVGMFPSIKASPWPLGLPFPPLAIVYDLIYNPPETAFVQAARAAGMAASNGLGMLIEQAALSFEIWTERTAPRQIMQLSAQEALIRYENPRFTSGTDAQPVFR